MIDKKPMTSEEQYQLFKQETKKMIKILGFEESFIRMAWSVSILLNKEISYQSSKKEDLR